MTPYQSRTLVIDKNCAKNADAQGTIGQIQNSTRKILVLRSINMTDVSGLTLHQKPFDEGLGPKRQSQLYSVVLEFFLCYSIFTRQYPTQQHFVHSSCHLSYTCYGRLSCKEKILNKMLSGVSNQLWQILFKTF